MDVFVRRVGELGCLWWCRMWAPSKHGRVEWVWTPSHGGDLRARLVALVSGSSVAPQRVFAQLARYGLPLASLAPPSCTSCGLRATRSRLAQGRGLLNGEKALQVKC